MFQNFPTSSLKSGIKKVLTITIVPILLLMSGNFNASAKQVGQGLPYKCTIQPTDDGDDGDDGSVFVFDRPLINKQVGTGTIYAGC